MCYRSITWNFDNYKKKFIVVDQKNDILANTHLCANKNTEFFIVIFILNYKLSCLETQFAKINNDEDISFIGIHLIKCYSILFRG